MLPTGGKACRHQFQKDAQSRQAWLPRTSGRPVPPYLGLGGLGSCIKREQVSIYSIIMLTKGVPAQNPCAHVVFLRQLIVMMALATGPVVSDSTLCSDSVAGKGVLSQ